ncbi:hypothetical protein EXU57_09520 [Segetibacter sp. 3557_3]|uniref:hypothetical protein n=1 Tax=Segetibacter sp. 3557_3 TaxID=2547429 RepID=UPI00105901C2|nr:hypothetical protein [Segetibacter sp. 3557_3]TDH27028.1 hypothetical protein EXU57_09520 [Segetibacter sp. 3557_3]
MENGNEIVIRENSLVIDVERAFNLYYPYLKIELTGASNALPNLKTTPVNPRNTISQLSPGKLPVKLDVTSTRTVAEFEQDIKTLLGMRVKISRKSGNVWNTISLTDNWTLGNQNNAGEFISKEMADHQFSQSA